MQQHVPSVHNRTQTLTDEDRVHYTKQLLSPLDLRASPQQTDIVVHADCHDVLPMLQPASVNLLILDPPYNLTKTFNDSTFSRSDTKEYAEWFESWFCLTLPLLKPDATVYVFADWFTSTAVYPIIADHLIVRNRITFQREKGRGSIHNWKSGSEDIWFCTAGKEYTFNVESVMQRHKVNAPYRDDDGTARDWHTDNGKRIRATYPSNIWTDITIPFWSMPENTPHPTQKPEKLLAKLILASSNEGDLILDPFLGSGTSASVAVKLNRRYIGIERESEYCCHALKRIDRAATDPHIQGYRKGYFLDRNQD